MWSDPEDFGDEDLSDLLEPVDEEDPSLDPEGPASESPETYPAILRWLPVGLAAFAGGSWVAGVVALAAPWVGPPASTLVGRLDPLGVTGPAWMALSVCALVAATSLWRGLGPHGTTQTFRSSV